MPKLSPARHRLAFGNPDRSLGLDKDLMHHVREQAARPGTCLSEYVYNLPAIYCSPLRRKTAEIPNTHAGLETALDRRMHGFAIRRVGMLLQPEGPLGEKQALPAAPNTR